MSVNVSNSEVTSRCESSKPEDAVEEWRTQVLQSVKEEDLIKMINKMTMENKNLKRVHKEEVSRLEMQIESEKENTKAKVDEEKAKRDNLSFENHGLSEQLNAANTKSRNLKEEIRNLKKELKDIKQKTRNDDNEEIEILRKRMAVLRDSEHSLRASVDWHLQYMSRVQGRVERAEGECEMLKKFMMFGTIY